MSIKPPHTLHNRVKPYARDNPWRSWFYIISTTVLLAIALTGTLPILPLSGRIACSLLSGLLMIRLFAIYHDQQHHAILPKSRLAEIFMQLFGIWALCPSGIWRTSHNYHHTHNSKLRSAHIGSFPIMTRDQFNKSSRGDQALYLFTRHPLTIVFGYLTVFLFGMVVYPMITAPRKNAASFLALFFHLLMAVCLTVVFGWLTTLLFLLIPFSVACALGSYLFYAQHNFPGVILGDKNGWTFEKAAMESSSYLKTGPIIGWFTGNIGYHHIHHLNHRVPFYRLPEVYRAIPELQQAKTTSLSPNEILRCLRLKVWCVERGQMVSLGG